MRAVTALAVADDLAVGAHPRRDGLKPVHRLATLLQHFLRGRIVNGEFPRDTIKRSRPGPARSRGGGGGVTGDDGVIAVSCGQGFLGM
jgi:hypothetical protein